MMFEFEVRGVGSPRWLKHTCRTFPPRAAYDQHTSLRGEGTPFLLKT